MIYLNSVTYAIPSRKEFIKMMQLWIIYNIRYVFYRNKYIMLTPPFFRKQVLYDRDARKYVTIEIGNCVDWIQIEHIYLNNDYDLSKMTRSSDIEACYRRILLDGGKPVIIDCGANIGLASKYFMERYPDSKVIGIEPDARNAALARRNNLCGSVEIELAGIASESMNGRLIDMGASNAFRVEPDIDGDLALLSVNSILNRLRDTKIRPFIIKIDIEGFESDLFSKNIEWVDEFPILIVELHDWMVPKRNLSKNFMKCMAARDRDFIHYDQYVISIENNIAA